MTKRMLIDANYLEETRVVVCSNTHLEDFDYESAAKKPLKGNIYLATITRVEPSLQAAFVDYGGNRHGFLPFTEIHPDYYRIPIADRQALLAEEAEFKPEVAESEVPEGESEGEVVPDEPDIDETQGGPDSASGEGGEPSSNGAMDGGEAANGSGQVSGNGEVEDVPVETAVDTIGGDDVDDAARRRARSMRRYKIQEVIKRRQVILIQVTKEERGNKGAALTSYLSLAGRYCVLMPNAGKGGGISRKISSAVDRRRLKRILDELSLPEGVATIVRTAGSQRTKAEIRRDYEFLLRLWDEIRETTLASTAPCLVYEEGNLIKRAIRDRYQSDMEEILVEGEEGHKAAKAFMKSLIPSHAKKVKLYRDPAVPLFYRHQVEKQIEAMYSPSVQLKSGGYIVIDMTEALVAIDVNSGRATRERNIEETAYRTNMEAAEEVARQLRLRDLAGLIVVDFIDMEDSHHRRAVERKLKDAMREDRARIQLGRISAFGLLELSRQRLRPSLFESSTAVCPNCNAVGYVRTSESAAMHVLRALEQDGIRRSGGEVVIAVPSPVALHIFNELRRHLSKIEERYNLSVRIETDDTLVSPAFRLDRLSAEAPRAEAKTRPEAAASGAPTDERKRSRVRRRRQKSEDAPAAKDAQPEPAEDLDTSVEATASAPPDESGEDAPKRRRRRGKRGGRRRARQRAEPEVAAEIETGETEATGDTIAAESAEPDPAPESEDSPATAAKPRRRRTRSGRKKKETAETEAGADTSAEELTEAVPEELGAAAENEATEKEKVEEREKDEHRPPAKRARRTRRKKPAPSIASEARPDTSEPVEAPGEVLPFGDPGHGPLGVPAERPEASEPTSAAAPESAPSHGEAIHGQVFVSDPAIPDPESEAPRRGWWRR